MLLTEFVDRIYRPLRLRQRSPNTTRLHHQAVARLGDHLGRPATVDDLFDELMLSAHLEARAAIRSPWTVERERSSLLALARLAWERGMIARLPVCPPAPMPIRTPTAWTVEELRRLFASAAAETHPVGPVPGGVWWGALLALLWESGERIGAVLDCRTSDLRGNVLTVRTESRKGRRHDRVISLSEATADRVREAHATGRVELLWWPTARASLWLRFRAICSRAGLRGDRVGFQRLRGSAASWIAAAGGDAPEFLGHATGSGGKVASTWYVDPRVRPKREPHRLLPPVPPAG